jgi:hypothetical protein
MRLPRSVVIERDKLLRYLLIHRPADDKSKYLGLAGFARHNADQLEHAIRELALTTESYQDAHNEYGVFWRTEGNLRGPSAELPVVLVWLQWFADDSFRFVTLKPRRER